MRTRSGALTAVLGVVVAGGGLAVSSVPVAGVAASTAPDRPAVVGKRIIGHSVKGRPIRAFRVGNPEARPKVVVLAAIHGDEGAPRKILYNLRDGRPVKSVDLWLVPRVNPDGVVRGSRKNAHRVDLNRNFPRRWAELDGAIESGPGPASEPETRALMRFLRKIKPRFVVSFHQPLHGIDTYGSKKRWFARRLVRQLNLPAKEFACGNACHGTLTQWFNHKLDGVAVTVEYGKHPSPRRMSARAPRQLLRALGGSR